MFDKYFKYVSVVLLAIVLTACGADVKVKTSLQGTKDVAQGEAVYLDNQVVGEVVDVSRSNGKTLVEIELDANGINTVMSDAAVVVNRLKDNSPLEIHNKNGSSEPVVDGQDLQGLDSIFQLGAWMVGDSIDLGSGAIADYVSAFQKYLQGDNWSKDKAEITQQATEAAKAAEVVVVEAGKELTKVVEEIKKAEEPMAQAVEQIGAELAPVIGELSKSGQSIMQELEKLTQNLEQQTNEGDREVGSRFFESLNKTLETINQSMEESLNEPQTGSQMVPNVDVNENKAKPALRPLPETKGVELNKAPVEQTPIEVSSIQVEELEVSDKTLAEVVESKPAKVTSEVAASNVKSNVESESKADSVVELKEKSPALEETVDKIIETVKKEASKVNL